MITAASDGSDVRVLNDSGFMSHFIWRDPSHILAYCKTTPQGKPGFFLLHDGPDRHTEQIAEDVVTSDGHCSYSPDGRWILYDTYPDANRNQHLYLYDVASRRRIELGAFQSPRQYKGEWRCDLHPRFSCDGRRVVIDSPHGGEGRQLYMIDVADLQQRNSSEMF